MKLGIGVSEDLPIPVQQRIATHVEAAGFRSLWTNEASGRDALLLCQAWAAETTDLDVGVGVVPIWTRSPAQLAMASATLQEASGGRFLLGLGVSHGATMGPWHGAEVRKPLTAASELLTILAQIEAGERSDVRGEVLSSRRFRLAIADRPPPTRRYLAAMGPRMLELAGSRAHGTLLNWAGPDEVAEAGRRVRDAARAAERDPEQVEVAAYVRVAVAEDRDAATGALAEQIVQYGKLPAYASHLERQGFGAALRDASEAKDRGADALAVAEALGEPTLGSLGWAGTPADDPSGMLDRFAAAGLDHCVLRVVVVDEPAADGVAAVTRAFDRFTGAV
jgi:alkanesulfonate monooxygenase SsuD/methylene tetrahydromethanopterin reductase-like flavin-dependent oxidoreductase (luciferase family)